MPDTPNATRPAPTVRGGDRRTPAPRRHDEALLHYARERVLAAAFDLAYGGGTFTGLRRAVDDYRAAESAEPGSE